MTKNIYLNNKVEYPDLRCEIIGTAFYLSDFKYQKKIWIIKNSKRGFWSNATMVLETFEMIEDDSWRDGSLVGISLLNIKEAELVSKVEKASIKLMEEEGFQRDDEIYLNSKNWQELVKAAKEAFEFFKQQGEDKAYIELLEKNKADKLAEYEEENS